MKARPRFFTLLEIMVGLSLLMIAAGAIGWKMNGLLDKRRFRTDLDQLRSRCHTLRRMAVNMQADWQAVLKPKGKNWIFEAVCADTSKPTFFPAIPLGAANIWFDGKKMDSFQIVFFSSGEIEPQGKLLFRRSLQEETWDLPGIFGIEEGDGIRKLGPVHPDEI